MLSIARGRYAHEVLDVPTTLLIEPRSRDQTKLARGATDAFDSNRSTVSRGFPTKPELMVDWVARG